MFMRSEGAQVLFVLWMFLTFSTNGLALIWGIETMAAGAKRNMGVWECARPHTVAAIAVVPARLVGCFLASPIGE
jgi:hypothetical protein